MSLNFSHLVSIIHIYVFSGSRMLLAIVKFPELSAITTSFSLINSILTKRTSDDMVLTGSSLSTLRMSTFLSKMTANS